MKREPEINEPRTERGDVNHDWTPNQSHRIAWLLFYGEWPENIIDHIDGDGLNNRIKNLADKTYSGNSRNQKIRKNNKSGVMGVRFNETKRGKPKWEARICVDGKKKRLGFFDTFDEAILARKDAENKYGYHANHGRYA